MLVDVYLTADKVTVSKVDYGPALFGKYFSQLVSFGEKYSQDYWRERRGKNST